MRPTIQSKFGVWLILCSCSQSLWMWDRMHVCVYKLKCTQINWLLRVQKPLLLVLLSTPNGYRAVEINYCRVSLGYIISNSCDCNKKPTYNQSSEGGEICSLWRSEKFGNSVHIQSHIIEWVGQSCGGCGRRFHIRPSQKQQLKNKKELSDYVHIYVNNNKTFIKQTS